VDDDPWIERWDARIEFMGPVELKRNRDFGLTFGTAIQGPRVCWSTMAIAESSIFKLAGISPMAPPFRHNHHVTSFG